jgi:hypothetical protein
VKCRVTSRGGNDVCRGTRSFARKARGRQGCLCPPPSTLHGFRGNQRRFYDRPIGTAACELACPDRPYVLTFVSLHTEMTAIRVRLHTHVWVPVSVCSPKRRNCYAPSLARVSISTAFFTAVSSRPACLEMREDTLRSSSPLISCAAATANAGPFNRVLSDCPPSLARGGLVSWLFVWLLYGHVIRLCNTVWNATASQLFYEARWHLICNVCRIHLFISCYAWIAYSGFTGSISVAGIECRRMVDVGTATEIGGISFIPTVRLLGYLPIGADTTTWKYLMLLKYISYFGGTLS